MKQFKKIFDMRNKLWLPMMATLLTCVSLTLLSVQNTAAQKRASQTTASIISGTSVGRGVTCPRFKLQSGETVSLSGKKRGIRPGKRFKLRGKWAAFSNCMQGRTFVVEK